MPPLPIGKQSNPNFLNEYPTTNKNIQQLGYHAGQLKS